MRSSTILKISSLSQLITARFTQQHDSDTIVTFEDSFFAIEPIISFGRQIRQTEGSGFDPDNPCSEVECVNPPVCTNTIVSDEITAQCGIFDETTSEYNCNYGFTGTLCDTAIDHCSANPCDATGSTGCTTSDTGFTCLCVEGYRGQDCSQEPQSIAIIEVPVEITVPGLTETVYDSMGSFEDTVLGFVEDSFLEDARFVGFYNFSQSFNSALPGINMDFEIHYIIFGSVSSRLVFSKSTDLEDVIKSIAGMDAEGVQLVNIGLTDAIENSQLLPIVDEKAGLLNANVTNDPTENTGKARSTIDVEACQLNTCKKLGKCTD